MGKLIEDTVDTLILVGVACCGAGLLAADLVKNVAQGRSPFDMGDDDRASERTRECDEKSNR